MDVHSEQTKGLIQQLVQAISSAEPKDCPSIIGSLEQLKALAWSRMTVVPAAPSGPAHPLHERWLSPGEVADRFHVTKKWLYKHKKNLPHSQPTRKTLRFPEGPIQRWFANRKRT